MQPSPRSPCHGRILYTLIAIDFYIILIAPSPHSVLFRASSSKMRSCGLPRYSVILLVVSATWVFTGEVAIHYFYSLNWQWPQLRLSRDYLESEFSQPDSPRVPDTLLTTDHHYHYQRGDSHYYIMPGSDQQDEGNGGAGLHVLIMSDPHIMCTFE